ncbi:RHS repeat domain-containing protein [Thalassoglobus sp.]|uniref:RHS repeat domain-containing protein n=1 Tax=Thalassoglobus sp. TaxID=2795869 RepID=UPI003AA984C9
MGSAKKTISYRYDANRNRTLMIDPDGGRTTYSYDALNRISSLINPQGERTTYAYDAKGRRTVKKLANGTRASFTYDAANRITTLANLKSDNTVISKFDYKYDNVGNRTEVAEADGSRVTWSYDATYQLTAEHRTGTVPYRNTFTYDSVGNRLVKNESGSRTTYSYDAANQLETSFDASGITTYTFDADGNQQLVQAPNNDRTTTTWDYENKTTLVELPTGIRNTMSYEPDGLRVKLEESTGTKKFIWDDQNYLAESDENNDINVVYTNEPNYYGNLVSQYRKSGAVWDPSYYHYEALGSTRQLTDNTEVITDTYLYDVWGNVINSSGSKVNPFQFTGDVGYYFDVDTENQYIRARIYRPNIGRWLSIDPLWRRSKKSPYVSFDNSGVLNTDPSGNITVTGITPPHPGCFDNQPNIGKIECGDTALYAWQFSLNADAPCDGYIIQKVTIGCRVQHCRLIENKRDKPIENITYTYYEAWEVASGSRGNVVDCASFDADMNWYGTKVQETELRFYCKNKENAPNGTGVTSSEGGDDVVETWYPGAVNQASYKRVAPCKVSSGRLPRKAGDPPKFWNSKPVEVAKINRDFSLGFVCCDCEPRLAIADASPRI